MVITDDPASLGYYLGMRRKHGLFNKLRKHLFVTTNPDVKDVVYGFEEFQYHAHTGQLQDNYKSVTVFKQKIV
jgi:nitroimidazol reductase NimA-like FMN-containing flavoprotein (pyridoxamine 5'-phosphate oxidase superfamily)